MTTTLINTPITISPQQLAGLQGWTIVGSVAYHAPCFAGITELLGVEVIAGTSYVVKYEIVDYVSGAVKVVAGGVDGANRAANGIYEEIIVVPPEATDLRVYFYSDGELGVKYLQAYPLLDDPNNGITLGFNAVENRWTSTYTYSPELLIKFSNDLFVFQEGRIWRANSGEVPRNNLFGEQFTSRLKLVCNPDPTAVKNYFTVREKSNKVWAVTDIEILPIEGKVSGQRSYIPSGNFYNLQGDWFADILRDATDPRFGSELQALFEGAFLQGNFAIFTFECTATDEVRLLSIDIEVSPQNYTY